MEQKFADVPDRLWQLVCPLLPPEKPRPRGGRPPVANRKILAGIVYRMKTGCQWKAIPNQFGSGATCHRRFSHWVQSGIMRRIWRRLLKFYDVKKGIGWNWTSLDSAIVKAPKGGTSRARTPQIAPRVGRSGTSSQTGAGSHSGSRSA